MPDTILAGTMPSSLEHSPVGGISDLSTLELAIQAACSRIAPLWPLKSFVAVNPFVGLTSTNFLEACRLMDCANHSTLRMPAAYYVEKIQSGQITDADLKSAITQLLELAPAEYAELLETWSSLTLTRELYSSADLVSEKNADDILYTVADLADSDPAVCTGGFSWQAFIVDEISKWCSAYYDQGQASWRMPWRDQPLFTAWKQAAVCDANPEIMGLKRFRAFVATLPDDPNLVIELAVQALHVAPEATTDFLHRELMSISGWSGYVRYLDREQAMNGNVDHSVRHLLAIRLCYDVALYQQNNQAEFRQKWASATTSAIPQTVLCTTRLRDHVLQVAAESAYRRVLFEKIAHAGSAGGLTTQKTRPAVQAVFCIDVRSEPFRRALESESMEIETIGFAGFFGFPIEYLPFGDESGGRAQCPVLIKPGYRIRETLNGNGQAAVQHALDSHQFRQRFSYGWNAFKTSAVSCFSFVETAGLLLGAKLVKESLGIHSRTHKGDALGPCVSVEIGKGAVTGIAAENQIALAAGALKNMGLTGNFGRMVLLCGHGSETANNPYGAALDCGACGGNTGEANALVAAEVLNSTLVRSALHAQGIEIPHDTHFLAGLHNTTTDEVTLFDLEKVPESHQRDIAQLQRWLKAAAHRARQIRASVAKADNVTNANIDELAFARSHDWAQTRPEWGLAGNAAFIAAPRERTRGVDLGGRAFLHSYDHSSDSDGSVLEMIMAAPMVVASWINLQYFASTVDNAHYGSGNKTIHNVVGTMGIWEGNSGDLKVGLPIQSLHDGRKWMHEPLRLTVVIEAPRSAINRAIAANAGVRELVDNGWVCLFAMEPDSNCRHQYCGDLRWRVVEASL